MKSRGWALPGCLKKLLWTLVAVLALALGLCGARRASERLAVDARIC
jgi:hypothetical protein